MIGKPDKLGLQFAHVDVPLRCDCLQILPPVSIPANLKVWGVDSGVRHSVGGQDYGSVRTAAFMGLKILSNLANRTSKYKQTSPQHRKDTDRADCLGDIWLDL